MNYNRRFFSTVICVIITYTMFYGQGTRLLQQADINGEQLVFVYGADIWTAGLAGGRATRITSTSAVERTPKFSPDGKTIAFSSNRTGAYAVYVVSSDGGAPRQLTFHPSAVNVVGWTPDGDYIVYESSRNTAPSAYSRLWKVPVAGGPSEDLPIPRGFRAAYLDEYRIVVEPISRWDVTWRAYRGGQNTSLIITDLRDYSETKIPCESTTDVHPVVSGGMIYFLSDRDWVSNIWRYNPENQELTQITNFEGSDIMWLSGRGHFLVFEREGLLHTFDTRNAQIKQIEIIIVGDFPWAEPRLENVSQRVSDAALSPNGKRIIVEARGEIFTVPVKDGVSRNLSKSSGAADRRPLWSPNGDELAWFSDQGVEGYKLIITAQDGLSPSRSISLGDAKLAWDATWSPDGKYIAFVDNKVLIKILDVKSGVIRVIDSGGINIERGNMGLEWSPDSQWLAYSKTGANMYRRVYAWSARDNQVRAMTNVLADSYSPSWDADGKYLYFLASTNLALGSGWANTSAMMAEPEQAAYMILLRADEKSPFPLRSDEELIKKEETPEPSTDDKTKKADAKSPKNTKSPIEEAEVKNENTVQIDWDGLENRTLALPIPTNRYYFIKAGKKGTAFIANNGGLHKFSIEDQKMDDFAGGVRSIVITPNREKILLRSGNTFRVVSTNGKPSSSDGVIALDLRMSLDRKQEWGQIFTEAWRYERDYFYDPSTHGRDWDDVWERYSPLIPFIQHRADLTYLLDQLNGELSVGHSFVFGGDYPAVDTIKTGLVGADFEVVNGHWRISHIYNTESWNPTLKAPLAEPGLGVKEGDYILAVNGQKINGSMDIFEAFVGTLGNQTFLHINDTPEFDSARLITVLPISSEAGLRQRAWVEDNRRRVEELSEGKLAYVWVPNTSGAGFESFNRYFFAQQDKLGAVIDERYNGGGLLDDYMVDLMTRKLRAAITNEVPEPRHFRLPAGILGPKVLLINETAGSGGDFFPWVFRNQNAGPLIGKRTWGGLVKSSVHYSFIDGGAMTSPDNAVFDPIRGVWIGENVGIAPDIEVELDAKSFMEGRDVQLERAVKEALRLLALENVNEVVAPPYPRPAVRTERE